jgi:hypothetical protein
MTGSQLATLSTLAWCVATTALFILLAQWSAGGSWGITDSIVRGVRGWARTTGQEVDLQPFAISPGAIESSALPGESSRGAVAAPDRRLRTPEPAFGAGISPPASRSEEIRPTAVVEDLGTRRLF